MLNSKNSYGYVYCIRNKTNGKMYIGAKLGDPVPIEKYHSCGKYLNEAIENEGLSNFEKIILDKDIPYDILNELEYECIKELKTHIKYGGYNGSIDGGWVQYIEPNSRSGKNNSMFGKSHSEISKIKMSISALKRPPVSNETKKKMSEAHKGRKYKPMSDDAKFNISISKSGIKMSHEMKKKRSLNRILINHKINKIHMPTNYQSFCKINKISYRILCRCINEEITYNKLTKLDKRVYNTLGWSYDSNKEQFISPNGKIFKKFYESFLKDKFNITTYILRVNPNMPLKINDLKNRTRIIQNTVGWGIYENIYAKENNLI